VREGAADRGEAVGSSGMQCEVVAVRIAVGRDMMIDERIDRRSMNEGRAADEEVNCSYRIELIVVDCSGALSKGEEMTDGGVMVGQRLCGCGEWEVADRDFLNKLFGGHSSDVGQCRGNNKVSGGLPSLGRVPSTDLRKDTTEGHDGKTRLAKNDCDCDRTCTALFCGTTATSSCYVGGSRGRERAKLGRKSSFPLRLLFLPRQNHQPAACPAQKPKCKKICPSHIISAKHHPAAMGSVPLLFPCPPANTITLLPLMFNPSTRAEVMTPSSNGLICTCFVLFPAKRKWGAPRCGGALKSYQII
jgi:hypothetical protein